MKEALSFSLAVEGDENGVFKIFDLNDDISILLNKYEALKLRDVVNSDTFLKWVADNE